MRQIAGFIFFMVLSYGAVGQAFKISYGRVFNDRPEFNNAPIVFVDQQKALISTENIISGKAGFPIEETIYQTLTKEITYVSQLPDGQIISAIDSTKATYELLSDTKNILGYNCKKARTFVNSNTIEIWYTNELPYFFSPSTLGINLGAVLETVRNGNTIIRAEKIEEGVKFPVTRQAKTYDLATYKDLVWKSRFVTLPIFDKELINWNPDTKAKEGVVRYANGTFLLKKVKFPVVEKDKNVFVELRQKSNGDAYDRTGSVIIIPEGREQNFLLGLEKGMKALPSLKSNSGQEYQGYTLTPQYLPNVELMRFFTSFGVGHFNYNQLKGKDWQEQDYFRQDITELKEIYSGKELYVGTYIGNYDKGGHEVSLEITIHPGGSRYHNFDFALPLFNTVNVMEMGGQNYATLFEDEKGLTVSFSIDTPLRDAKLRYITTGHGGWGGGDEFLPKANRLFLDQTLVSSFVPWRQDCGSYRLNNPVSGNFSSGLSSSDLSRSNWCPATVTNPNFIDLGDLEVGSHTIQIKIPQGPREGSSFSFWNVSGILLGNLRP